MPGLPAHRPLQAAKRQAVARGERVQMVDTDWRWWPQRFVDENPCRVGARGLPAACCCKMATAPEDARKSGLVFFCWLGG